MNTLRFWGVSMLPLCGWMAGASLRQKSLAHIAELEKVILLLQRLKQEILFRRTDLKLLYSQLCAEGVLENQSETRSFRDIFPPEVFSGAEKKCFEDCMMSLGKTPAAQQVEQLECYQKRFETFLQQALQNAEKQARLPCQIGACAGAVLALFFL